MAADGTVTGNGTKWQSSLSLIRPGATIMFLSSPIQMAVVNKVVSDTEIKAITTKGAVVASSDYAILLSDSLTVDGLAQDVAETLRYYQSQETVIADAVEFFKTFDFESLQNLANQIKADSEAAGASATAAAASETAAKTSETNAKASQVAAETAIDQVQQIINNAGEQSTLVVLAQPTGAGKSGLLQGGTVQDALIYLTPEMFGAVGDGVTYDDAALQSAVNIPNKTVVLNGTYRTTTTIVPAEGVSIIGRGKIVNESTQSFTWSRSSRSSQYPAIMVNKKNVYISGITIESTYESVQAAPGGDNLTIFFVTCGGASLTSRSKSSALVFFYVSNVKVSWCDVGFTGNLATWDGTDIQTGACDGIDFGGVRGIDIAHTYCHDVGCNGINWYGASDVTIDHCHQKMCGQSGIQPGPHPDYSGVTITSNFAEYCCADAIDVRYTGSSAVDIDLTMTNCRSNWIGMLYGDVNYISDDGSGICTLAYVSNFNISNCNSKNASGAILWIDGCSDGVLDNIIGKSNYTRTGVGFFRSCSRIKTSNLDIVVKGSALWFGGSITLTDVSFGGVNHIESLDGFALLMPNNNLVRFSLNNATLIGYKTCNIIFKTVNVEIITKGTEEVGAYLGAANIRHDNFKVSGTTTGYLVHVGVGNGVVIDKATLINDGAGATICLDSSFGFILSKSTVWNTGTGGGDAMKITGSQNGSVLDKNDIYSASGRWMNSTAESHTKLITDNQRENGAVAAYWASITNVENVLTTQRT